MTKEAIAVWDPLVRLFHWSLVLAFIVSWISGDEWDDLHEISGYVVAGLIAFRLIWGLIGPKYARFKQFVRSPSEVIQHVKDVLAFKGPRYIGHNPAGGIMILLLLVMLSITSLTGWLMTTDMFWGSEVMEEVHEFGANFLLLLVGVHVVGVAWESLLHGENLARSMVTGQKRMPSGEDIS
ncbi:cytochrome b/b6 domain-containing protein [Sneathiella limimaris]|uniref:cytochrome b/b6 domain-containing protein n=1 Tax=Sneathiella limimaris TaxID=1964213 RepID=UPI00146AFD6A|nr:cytochrome b/b6 domain-containing protein [Sneathiella limimaris]